MMDQLTPDEAYKRVTGQQKLAAIPEASAWVSANAGSGKTKVLIDRVARLLLAGATPDSILCITYTKAAASEMQQRLFKRLGGWSVMGDDALARDLNELQDIPVEAFDRDRLKNARALFAKALETPGGLRIETLHAFAGRVLRRFPLEAGVPPGFTELADVEGGKLWERASRRAFLEVLDDPERAADFRTLVRNVGGLGLNGALDLIKGKATRLRMFLQRFGSADQRRKVLSTFLGAPDCDENDLIVRLVNTDLPVAAYKQARDELRSRGNPKTDADLANKLDVILHESDLKARFEMVKRLAFTGAGAPIGKSQYTKKVEGGQTEDLFHFQTGSEIHRIQQGISEFSALTLRDRTLALLSIAEPVLREHTSEKKLHAGLDFDDLIVEARNLLTGPGMAEWVLFKLDGGISHVLLDEAQDTSPDQWLIVNTLVDEFFAGASASQQIRTQFVVGDEKQSIYSFQGADTAKFQAERRAFASRVTDDQQGVKFNLPEIEMSFRTTPQGRAPFSTETASEADLIRHHAYRHDQPGKVEFWDLEERDVAVEGVPWDAPLDIEKETSPAAQLSESIANWIADRINNPAQGVWTDERTPRPRLAKAGDILILVRSRGPLFKALIQALKGKGLPVAGADRVNLLDTLAVQDVLNLIRFVLCPEDDLTVAEVIKGPFIGLLNDDEHLFPLAWDRGRESLWSRLQASADPRHDHARAFLQKLLGQQQMPAFEFLNSVLTRVQTDGGLSGWQLIDRRFGMPARDPLEALLAIAGGMDDGDAASLQVFLNAVENQDSDIKRELSGPSGEIRVMTVHGAKGLEAPIVILPDTTGVPKDRLTGNLVFSEEGVPVWLSSGTGECDRAAAIREREKARAVAEGNRLLYVGLTRARDHLVVCGAWHGSANGQGFSEGSWYDICARTLDDFARRPGVTRENGRWSYGRLPSVDVSELSASEAVDVEPHPLPVWLRKPVSLSGENTVQRAPSQLLPGDTPVLPPFGRQHLKRFQRGRLIHALLEILPDVPEADRKMRAERYLAQCLSGDDAALKEDVMADAFRVLNSPELAEVFGPGGRAEAPIVGRGPHLLKGLIINGRVDRLRITQNEVLVIDYKTDRPPPKREEDVAPPYLAQMGSYFDVLSTTYPDKSVKCALLWTDGPYFMVLSESAMLDALKKTRGEA